MAAKDAHLSQYDAVGEDRAETASRTAFAGVGHLINNHLAWRKGTSCVRVLLAIFVDQESDTVCVKWGFVNDQI